MANGGFGVAFFKRQGLGLSGKKPPTSVGGFLFLLILIHIEITRFFKTALNRCYDRVQSDFG